MGFGGGIRREGSDVVRGGGREKLLPLWVGMLLLEVRSFSEWQE